MIITFPHLGDAHIAVRLFFHEMGIEVLVPEMNSAKTLERGAAISPEEICLPFKIMAGNLTDAFERGADTVVIPSTAGPCRLGEFAELLNSVLKKAGMAYNFIILESPIKIGFKAFIGRFAMIVPERKAAAAKAPALLARAARIMREMDCLCAKAFEKAGKAKEPGECASILRDCRAQLNAVMDMKAALRIIAKWDKALDQVELNPRSDPVRLLLTGEIYSLIEPFANRNIEEKLMNMGVSFKKQTTISWWIKHTVSEAARSGPFRWMHKKNAKKCENLPYNIGGYAKETVAEASGCKLKGYDGVIQILPTGCMPEIVAKSVLGRISAESGLKVLTIIFDEMDGEAGYITRLEAFVDMLERRGKCII